MQCKEKRKGEKSKKSSRSAKRNHKVAVGGGYGKTREVAPLPVFFREGGQPSRKPSRRQPGTSAFPEAFPAAAGNTAAFPGFPAQPDKLLSLPYFPSIAGGSRRAFPTTWRQPGGPFGRQPGMPSRAHRRATSTHATPSAAFLLLLSPPPLRDRGCNSPPPTATLYHQGGDR